MNHYSEAPRIHPPGVVIPLEWLTMFQNISRPQAGEALMAILTYGATGAVPDFTDPGLQLLWPIFQARLDSDRERYCKKVERSRAYPERQNTGRSAPASSPAPQKPGRPTPLAAAGSRAEQEKSLDKWL